MYGTSGKLGRGGGRGGGGGGGGKRNIHSSNFHPSNMNRPSSASGRLSTASAGAAPRSRSVSSSVPTSSAPSTFAATEEAYSLVTSNPLNFGMSIRLAPNLVEEIQRLEAQGGAARIKFDGNINNPVGNIISVGDKEFRFKWSSETGDLCDIYEERRSGDDGNGLMVESGSVWRRLNVQRVLDESTKNHVKLRTEEASRKLKSRKAIVLDHGNPSTKSQIKAMAAAESNPWKSYQPKKEQPPAKKRKVEPVSGPPKSLHKSGLTETPPSKARVPISPLSSPPEQLGAPASPFGGGNTTKGHADMKNISLDMNRTIDYDKDTGGRVVNSSFEEKAGRKGSEINQPSDLRTVLISLLTDSSLHGMSLKALERAAEDAIPNSSRQIEPILKKIATFQAPGRYFLKPGVEIDSFNRPLSERQSYPEGSLHPLPENGKKFDPPDVSDFTLPGITDQCEDQKMQFMSEPEEAPDFHEKLDALHADLFGDKKESDNNEGPAVSSSDSSDSGSDSDSSDSGSDSGSHSRSRSRSLADSKSASSSGSESDASTNNKEVSDEDVDIMNSDDDPEKHRLQASRSVLPKSPVVLRAMDGELGLIENAERQDVHSMFEIEKDSPMPEHVNEPDVFSDSLPKSRGGDHVEEVGPLSRYQSEHQERQNYSQKVDSERDPAYKGGLNLELSETSAKVSRGKSKRASDEKKLESKSNRDKRLKAGNISPQHISGLRNATSVECHQNPFDRPSEGTHWSSSSLTENTMPRDESVAINSQNDYDKVISGKSISDAQQLGSANPGGRAKTSATKERSGKDSENSGRNVRHPDKSHRATQSFNPQKLKFNGETKEDPCLTSYTGSAKSSKDGFRDKHVPSVDSYQRSVVQTGNLLKDDEANTLNKSAGNGRKPVLQRELSDLELGELREPLPEVPPGYINQAERKNTSKQAENKSFSLDALNSNTGKRKPPSKATAGPVINPAPINSDVISSGIQEGMQKRVTPQHHAEDIPRSHPRAPQAIRPHRPRSDQMDIATQSNSGIETGSRGRLEDAERSADTAPEVLGQPHSRLSANAPKEHIVVQEGNLPPRKESRKPKPNILPDLNNRQKDASLTESNDSSHRKRESSSDENSCPYSKYEKEEPQLKGTIRDYSEYSEYVKEYKEKYDIYVSLNRVLESYREEFLKYQREIETSVKDKDKERYSKLVRKIKESFEQSVERHKRLKKIFFVLHEELQNLKKRIMEFAAPYLKNQ